MTPADLYTARGEHMRRCPLGPMEAWETVKKIHPGATYVRLDDTQTTIVVRFPGTAKVYTYDVRPAPVARVIEFPVRQTPAGQSEVREGA